MFLKHELLKIVAKLLLPQARIPYILDPDASFRINKGITETSKRDNP